MADRALTLSAAGLAAAIFLLLLAPLGALGLSFQGFTLSAAELSALRFTLLQAGLSALISVVLAVPVARALARRRFFGRGVLISTLGAPFILPVIVAVLGLLAVFGRAGWVNGVLAQFGLPVIPIYGLQGVVLAHVFFNMPLAVRMVLHGWEAIPAERFRLAAGLGFTPADISRHIERPMLRAVLPGTALVIFVICLTSFAVALTLGGGPRATTVELAIYQALRFEFDLPSAARLALLQFALCALAYALAGDAGAAQECWRSLAQAGLYSDRPEDRELANMFLDSAGFGSRTKPLLLDDLARYPVTGVGSLVFFVAGVTDWSLGDKEAAARLLARFLEIDPAPEVEGWSTYRRVAERLLSGG